MNQYKILSPENEKLLQEGVSTILKALDFKGPDFDLTPERLGRALRELCAGLDADVDMEVFKDGIFDVPGDRRIPTRFDNISARGLCPHHLLPIIYTATVAYEPKRKVVGLSRIHRLVKILAARPVLQEQLVYDIAKVLQDKLNCPVYVKLEGLHMCMCARGSKTEMDSIVTSEIKLE